MFRAHWYYQAAPGCSDICLETSQSQSHRSQSLPEEQTAGSSLPGTLKAPNLVLRSLCLRFCLRASPASFSLKTCSCDLSELPCLSRSCSLSSPASPEQFGAPNLSPRWELKSSRSTDLHMEHMLSSSVEAKAALLKVLLSKKPSQSTRLWLKGRKVIFCVSIQELCYWAFQ